MFRKCLVAATTAMISMSLCACVGGGEEEEEDEGPDDASGAGIWAGTYRPDGQSSSAPMFGLVTEEGEFALVATGSASRSSRFFFGTGTTDGDNFSANAVSYSATGKLPASLAGTVVDGSSIDGSYSVTGDSATFTLNYDTAYERNASFATLAGIYTLTAPATTLTVDVRSNGSFMYTSSATGCTITGSFTIPHSDRNYYRWSGTASGCSAGDGSLNGLAWLSDTSAGQNRRLTMLGQNQAQTAPLLVSVSK
jgi:hypothetical protein